VSYVTGTRTYCDNVKAARDKLLGSPVRGIRCGGGVHAQMPATWDGVGRVPEGWTGYDGPIENAGSRGTWAVDPGGPETTQALADARAARVNTTERTLLTTAVTNAVSDDSVPWVRTAG
jgi:hypothetical protein